MALRPTLRRLALGLATLSGLRRRGWFIPYRYADSLPEAGTLPPYAAIARLFADCAPAFDEMLAACTAYEAALTAIARREPPASIAWPGPPARFDQAWFPTLDAAVAYVMVRTRKPARIVEVGSGHSTRFLARAAIDAGHDVAITAIDPAPRADIAGLPGVTVQRCTVQAADPALFGTLRSGDLLSIDSSHILMPGSDVDLLLNRVLPELPAGALVHIHDVFLPDDYPAGWAWRGYNEQLGVATLLASGGWRPLFASHWIARHRAEVLARSAIARLPAHPEARPASLWLVRTG
jgi:hypothetical protein